MTECHHAQKNEKEKVNLRTVKEKGNTFSSPSLVKGEGIEKAFYLCSWEMNCDVDIFRMC